MTIDQLLQQHTNQLASSGIESPQLDAQLLLAHTIGRDRAWLFAHNDDELTDDQLAVARSYVSRRINHEPVAYIVGYKEFFGLQLSVNKHVLIPRPETETMIELLDDLGSLADKQLLDVGTGSGALAIAAKKQYPILRVSASDASPEALAVARQNASHHHSDIQFYLSDLLSDIHDKFDVILANLPYVPPDHAVSADVLYEPKQAVFCEHDGLQLIEQLFVQSQTHLKLGGYILVESLPHQMRRIKQIASKQNLDFRKRSGLVQLFRHWQ